MAFLVVRLCREVPMAILIAIGDDHRATACPIASMHP
jgi:hypothetical protein